LAAKVDHGVPGNGIPEQPGNPWQWDDNMAARNNGNGWWRYATAPQPAYYAPPIRYAPPAQYYPPPRASYQAPSFGGCSS
jgi:hypothetical protein